MENRAMVNAGAPPPPSEVKIRTMRSDLESMAKSGGGMPRFENVAVEGLTEEKEYVTPSHATSFATPVAAPQAAPVSDPSTPSSLGSPKKNIFPIIIVILVALIAIGGVGYFAYVTFFASTAAVKTLVATVATTTPGIPAQTTTGTTTTTVAATPPASLELSNPHASLFIKPADQVITIDFAGTNATTYQKTMTNSLSAISPASTIVEIDPKAGDGNNLSMAGLLSVAGASVLNAQALASLNPDPTFFVYRDKNGLWPGYVLTLNAGQTSSSVMVNVQQLESSNSIENLFLTNPGTPSSGGFNNTMIAGYPVRTLTFSGTTAPLNFTYGWYENYLILSTSENGFGAAIAKLQ